MSVDKPLQQRRTLEDTIAYQTELLELIRKKKERNAVLSFEERDRFMRLYPLSVKAHGSNPCYYKTRNGRVVRFDHLDMFAYFLQEATTNYVDIINEDTGHIYDKHVPVSDLWAYFERKIIYIRPFAREEAEHMSAEVPIHEASTSYVFSSKK